MPSARYRPLRPEDIRPAAYLRGMDPDDPLPTPEELLRQKRRRDRPRLLLIAAAVLMLLAFALIAMAAGWS